MGFSLIAGIVVLSIMILPTIASIASDAIRSVPFDYLEASYGLGSTKWQAISRVIVPAAKKGIFNRCCFRFSACFWRSASGSNGNREYD